jgi:hypothetical protein
MASLYGGVRLTAGRAAGRQVTHMPLYGQIFPQTQHDVHLDHDGQISFLSTRCSSYPHVPGPRMRLPQGPRGSPSHLSPPLPARAPYSRQEAKVLHKAMAGEAFLPGAATFSRYLVLIRHPCATATAAAAAAAVTDSGASEGAGADDAAARTSESHAGATASALTSARLRACLESLSAAGTQATQLPVMQQDEGGELPARAQRRLRGRRGGAASASLGGDPSPRPLQLTIDASPMYLSSVFAPLQLRSISTDTKVVVLLREPLETIKSLYLHRQQERECRPDPPDRTRGS